MCVSLFSLYSDPFVVRLEHVLCIFLVEALGGNSFHCIHFYYQLHRKAAVFIIIAVGSFNERKKLCAIYHGTHTHTHTPIILTKHFSFTKILCDMSSHTRIEWRFPLPCSLYPINFTLVYSIFCPLYSFRFVVCVQIWNEKQKWGQRYHFIIWKHLVCETVRATQKKINISHCSNIIQVDLECFLQSTRKKKTKHTRQSRKISNWKYLFCCASARQI